MYLASAQPTFANVVYFIIFLFYKCVQTCMHTSPSIITSYLQVPACIHACTQEHELTIVKVGLCSEGLGYRGRGKPNSSEEKRRQETPLGLARM